MVFSTRVLVTGAAGFVGSHVVRRALERGLHVIAAVRPESSLDRLAGLDGAVEIVRADITDAAAVTRLAEATRPDVCVHLAATGAVVVDPDLDRVLATNAMAPGLLARALAGVGCARLVTAGSSSEYGPVEVAMDERDAPTPNDPYGCAKLAGGLLARAVGKPLGLETNHLRLFSVYGPGEDARRLVPSVVRSLLLGRPVELTPGAQVRDFVYATDVADVLLEAALRPGLDGVTVNVGSGVETTVRELCLAVADVVGGHDLLRFGAKAYRENERFHWRASTERAEALGLACRTTLRDGVRLTAEHEARALKPAVPVAA